MARTTRRKRVIGKAARNERRKAAATTLNAISVAVLIAAIIQPLIGHRLDLPSTVIPFAIFLGAQAALHYILGALED